MKTPPLLLGATLLFWGWETGFFIPALVMAAVLEGARIIKARWDFSDEDFNRIWTFCTLVFLASAVYAFTSNQGPSGFRGLFESPNVLTQRNASNATSRTTASLLRWLPMVFCLFIAAQTYSSREGIPLETISMLLRWRWKRAKKLGQPSPTSRTVDVSYPYFALCLFAASVRTAEDSTFFWGFIVLLGWGLWPLRTPRFSRPVWAGAFITAVALGYIGQTGVNRLQVYLANLNPQWLLGFSHRRFDPAQSRTEIGSIGMLKASSQIVVRLETKTGRVPSLLREASYRSFRGQTWYAEAEDRDFFNILETNSTSYVLVPGKTNDESVSIACYLDGGKGLLPLPTDAGELDNLTAYILSKNSLGAVLVAEGPGLVVFDAHYGPGAMIDSAPVDSDVTSIPPKEIAALDQVIAEQHLSGLSTRQAVRELTRYFLSKYTYSIWQRPHRFSHPTESPLTRFLLRTHTGHCEYFATAGVLLLRRLGIPARYAVGYAVHEGVGNKYVVRQRDAHAWCLVWDQRAQVWQNLDLTPGTWIAAEAQRASPFQWLRDAWSRFAFEFSKIRWGQSHWRRYLLWALVPTLALLLYRIIFQTRRRRTDQPADASVTLARPGLDSEFYLLELSLSARGLPRHPSEPLSEWLQRAADAPALAALNPSLRALLYLHYRYRFDPLGLAPAERAELRQAARTSLTQLEAIAKP